MADNNQNSAGFLVGLVMGAVGTLLLSPKSGEEMRRDIRKFAEEKTLALKDDLEERRDQLQKELAKIEDKLSEKAQDFKESANQTANKAKNNNK